MKRFRTLLSLVVPFCTVSLYGATWYVDCIAHGANDGRSWASAWTTMAAVTGVTRGDIVYISGGPTGTSQTYAGGTARIYPGQWLNAVNGVTYQIGQDSAHNGTAIFDGQGGSYWLAQSWVGVTVNGNASDGQMHFQLKNMSVGSCGNGCNWTNVHIAYINFQQQPGGIDFNPCGNGVEIDHCYCYVLNDLADHFSYANCVSGTGYDTALLFHDNTIFVPRLSPTNGFGADCLQYGGTGFSIYNNTITSYPSSTYKGGQHQDGWQGSGGAYIKVYGNRFTDLANYCIFPEASVTGYTHMRIFDNICVNTTGTTQAIAIGANSSIARIMTDVICDNNVTDGFSNPITFHNPGGNPDPKAFIECSSFNNAAIAAKNYTYDAAVATEANVIVTPGNARRYFSSYTAKSATNDYHLTRDASALIAHGVPASDKFTKDRDGNTMPQNRPWDLGAYKLAADQPEATPSR